MDRDLAMEGLSARGPFCLSADSFCHSLQSDLALSTLIHHSQQVTPRTPMDTVIKRTLEQLLKMARLYYPMLNLRARIMAKPNLRRWEQEGKPSPPPHIVKLLALKGYADRFRLRSFI